MYSFPPLLDTSSSLFAYLCVFLSIIIHHRPEYVPDHAEHHIFNDWLLTIAGISNQRSKKPPRLRVVQPVEKGKPVKIKHHAGHRFLFHEIPPFLWFCIHPNQQNGPLTTTSFSPARRRNFNENRPFFTHIRPNGLSSSTQGRIGFEPIPGESAPAFPPIP